MGGVIAQSYAMNNPEKVSRLVLSDTFGELKTLGTTKNKFSMGIELIDHVIIGNNRYFSFAESGDI